MLESKQECHCRSNAYALATPPLLLFIYFWFLAFPRDFWEVCRWFTRLRVSSVLETCHFSKNLSFHDHSSGSLVNQTRNKYQIRWSFARFFWQYCLFWVLFSSVSRVVVSWTGSRKTLRQTPTLLQSPLISSKEERHILSRPFPSAIPKTHGSH